MFAENQAGRKLATREKTVAVQVLRFHRRLFPIEQGDDREVSFGVLIHFFVKMLIQRRQSSVTECEKFIKRCEKMRGLRGGRQPLSKLCNIDQPSFSNCAALLLGAQNGPFLSGSLGNHAPSAGSGRELHDHQDS